MKVIYPVKGKSEVSALTTETAKAKRGIRLVSVTEELV